MRIRTTLLLVILSFLFGYSRRPAVETSVLEAFNKADAQATRLTSTNGRQPASVAPLAVQHTDLTELESETVDGIDIVEAMQRRDMAQVFQAASTYEKAWLNKYFLSRFQLAPQSDQTWNSKIMALMPSMKEQDIRYYRGTTTIQANGKPVFIDVMLKVMISTFFSGGTEAPEKQPRPCFSIEGYLSSEKSIERIGASNLSNCGVTVFEKDEQPYISFQNYRNISGSLVSLLLFPANPAENRNLEYLPANSADWESHNGWAWRPVAEAERDRTLDDMHANAADMGLGEREYP